MTITDAIDALDEAVQGVAHDPRLTQARVAAMIRDWSEGGCAVFAQGIRQWLGPETRLVGVRDGDEPTIDHVAATWRGLYFDAHGVRDESDFLFDAETIGLYRMPQLVEVSDPAALPHISFDADVADVVTRALRARLDPVPVLAALARG